MILSFNDINDFQEFIKAKKTINYDLANLEFKRGAIFTELGNKSNKAYNGDLYKAPTTAPKYSKMISYDFDLNQPYEIQTNEDGVVLSFSFFEKGKETPTILKGLNARTPLYQFLGALSVINLKHAEIINLSGRTGR